MKTRYIISLVMLLSFISCGYSPIMGKVVDAETGRPIDDAVILVEWTKAEGVPGLVSTKSYKVVETVTDKDGKFFAEGLKKIFIDAPSLTIYKKGYVAWNNKRIFPGNQFRTDFKWQNGNVYKLERFDPAYSYVEHDSFVSDSIHRGAASEQKGLFITKYDEGEELNVMRERSNTSTGGGLK